MPPIVLQSIRLVFAFMHEGPHKPHGLRFAPLQLSVWNGSTGVGAWGLAPLLASFLAEWCSTNLLGRADAGDLPLKKRAVAHEDPFFAIYSFCDSLVVFLRSVKLGVR